MQQKAGQLEEELMNVKHRLCVAEGERDRISKELKEIKKLAEAGNGKPSNGKVADIYSELNSAMDSLSKSNKELNVKEIAIASLKAELEKVKDLESRLADKDFLLEKLKGQLTKIQSSEARTLDLLNKSNGRVEQLEQEIEQGKDSTNMMLDSLALQTKQLEQAKMLLEESKIHGAIDHRNKSSSDNETDSLRSELWLMRESERNAVIKAENLAKEMESLKLELKLATGAEENSKKALDDLAFALKEVATEANQAKLKLSTTEENFENLKKETEDLKLKLKNVEEKNRNVLEEVKKEAERYRNTADRLRLEAEETLVAWNEKETGLVDCIKRSEEEKAGLIEENNKLVEALTTAENINKTAKQENQKLRDILKQALNEANVAKEAAGIARVENSQLKDLLAEKDDALIFITRENENLRINEANANENIKELKRLLDEALSGSGKEIKTGEDHTNKEQTPPHQRERKLSNAFSINLKDLLFDNKPKDAHEDVKNGDTKPNEPANDDDDSENIDPLKGSIFDVDSPVAPPPPAEKNHHHHHQHHHRRKSSSFNDDGEGINAEELEHIEGHTEEGETERNSKKKRALLRRFGDIITGRKSSVHRRESSLGGDAHKKELAAIANEGNKQQEIADKKETSPATDQTLKKDTSLAE